jgi:integrase
VGVNTQQSVRRTTRPPSYILGPRAQEIVAPWLRRDPSEYLFQPVEAQAERQAARRAARTSKVPPSQVERCKLPYPRRPPGLHYSTASYGQAVRFACRKAEVPHWQPHQLRHAWTTRVGETEGIERTSEALGHATVNVTELYLERRAKAAAEIARKHG